MMLKFNHFQVDNLSNILHDFTREDFKENKKKAFYAYVVGTDNVKLLINFCIDYLLFIISNFIALKSEM